MTQELKLGLCDNLEDWNGVGDGREVQEGGDTVYLWLIHVDVWQKPAQYCEAVILQFKINKQQQQKPLLWVVTARFLNRKCIDFFVIDDNWSIRRYPRIVKNPFPPAGFYPFKLTFIDVKIYVT